MENDFKIINQVLETTNYSKFSKLPNQPLTRSGKKLIQSFVDYPGHDTYIIVNTEHQIIDGNRRFDARKELGLPIQYIVDKKANSLSMMIHNGWQDKWRLMDFLHHHSVDGLADYIAFGIFREKYKLLPGSALALLTGSTKVMDFKLGKMKIKNIDVAHSIAVAVDRLCTFGNFKRVRMYRAMYQRVINFGYDVNLIVSGAELLNTYCDTTNFERDQFESLIIAFYEAALSHKINS